MLCIMHQVCASTENQRTPKIASLTDIRLHFAGVHPVESGKHRVEADTWSRVGFARFESN